MKRKTLIIDLFLLFIINILFFFKVLFINRFLCATSELLAESFSFHFYNGNLLRNGAFPIWEPYHYLAFAGISFTSAFYLFSLIISFIGSFLSINASFFLMQIGLILHIYLASVFMYVFLSSLKLRREGIWLGAIAFSYSCFVIHGTQYASFLYTLVWFPLIFYYFTKAIDELNYKFSIFVGLALTMSLLGGYTPTVFYACAVLLFYFIWSILFDITSRGAISYAYLFKLIRLSAVMFVVTIGLSAVFTIPTIEYSLLSTRLGKSYEVITAWASVEPLHLITIFFPHFFGGAHTPHWGWMYTSSVGWWEMMYYVGITTFIMAIMSLIFQYERRLSKIQRFFILLSILILFFMMGRYSAALGMLYAIRIIPVTRVVSRWGFFLVFSLSTLSAIGFSALCTEATGKWKQDFKKILHFIIKPLTIIIFISLIPLSIALLKNGHLQSIRSIIHFSIFYTATITFLFFRLRSNYKYLGIIFLIACFFDIFLASYRVYPIFPEAQASVLPSRCFKDYPLIEFLNKDRGIYRVSNLPWPLTQGEINRIFTLGYSGGFSYQRFVEFRGEVSPMGTGGHDWFSLRPNVHSQIIDFYNIKYLISKYPLDKMDPKYERIEGVQLDNCGPMFEFPATGEPHYLYKNKNVFNRAFCVFAYIVIEDDKEILAEMEKLDLGKTVILEEEAQTFKPIKQLKPEIKGNVEIVKYSPSEVDIDVYNARPGFLVLTDVWYPGWKAYVDGCLAKIYRADYVFRAIELPEGKHAVKFKYDPIAVKLGAAISGLTVIILLSVWFLSLRKRG